VPAPVVRAKVSNRGQTSLPAELRHRWGIEGGGDVAFVDLGEAALILPGMDRANAELKRVLAQRDDAGLAAIDDPDFADKWSISRGDAARRPRPEDLSWESITPSLNSLGAPNN
jgi:bifunctional DNA-binding transcriptional regulator/antitoxin component of YhaV-PrlF toxin-antitoxin module